MLLLLLISISTLLLSIYIVHIKEKVILFLIAI